MTDKKISQLDAAATLDGSELVEVVQAGANKRTTAQALAEFGSGSIVVYKFLYSFAVDGGAQGILVLRQAGGPLPIGFIVTAAALDVTVPLGSGGLATAALATPQSGGDLLAATAFSVSPWSTIAVTFVGPSTAQPIKLSASRSPTLTIAGANLNAGIFDLYLQGIQT